MEKYILSAVNKNGENNAGFKARNDVIKIARECEYKLIPLFETNQAETRVQDVISGIIAAWKLKKKLTCEDVVLLQYPIQRTLMKSIYKILKKSNVKIITLIHDIDYLRNVSLGKKGVEGMKEAELSLLNNSDYLICHNEKMLHEMQKEGLHANYISLQLFDYLYDGNTATISDNRDEIIVAGNLLESKAGYLYELNDSKHHFHLSLYGSCFNEEHFHYSKACYHGSYPPDKLIENLQGAYGLVWDGSSTKRCEGSYGKYLRINNPHKVSLYIAAGLPVIIWKEAALCAFVEEQQIGFGIESLDDLDQELEIHAENYDTYLKNISELRTKVCEGWFLKTALKEIDCIIKRCGEDK